MNKIRRRLLACVLAVMLCMAAFPISALAEGGDYYESELPPEQNPDVLVPEGNMDLVSDITGEAANEKEFITVVTKNGNYFYIIIDRSAKGSNTVHFLNQVDESDLLALLSEEEIGDYFQSQEPAPTPEPTPTPTPMPAPTVEPEEPAKTDESNAARGIVLLVLFAALGALVFFYLRSKKAKPATKGSTDLDDYDFGEEDDGQYAEFESYNPNDQEDKD